MSFAGCTSKLIEQRSVEMKTEKEIDIIKSPKTIVALRVLSVGYRLR